MVEESVNSVPPHKFLYQLERVLMPSLMECFSEETKKVRNLVLFLAFLLILLALGVLSVEQKPVELPLIKATVTVTKGVTGVLIALCGFFTVMLAARSYTEWHLWSLKNLGPSLELVEINEKMNAARGEIDRRRHVILQDAKALRNGGSMKDKDAIIQRLLDERGQHGAEDEQLFAMQIAMLELMTPVRRSYLFRLWLEGIFPVAFAAIAIVWAAVRLRVG